MAPRVQVPLADGAQVRLWFRLGGFMTENRLWFVNRQPPTTHTQLVDLGIGVRDWYVAEVMPWLGSELSGQHVRVDDWSSIPPPDGTQGSFSASGGNSGGTHSANVSVLVRFQSAQRPPFIYNWNHIPGIPLDAVDTNIVATYFKNAMFNAYVDLIDLAAGFGPFPAWRWVCTSSVDGGAYRTTQDFLRTDFIQFPSRYVSPFRQRLKKSHIPSP